MYGKKYHGYMEYRYDSKTIRSIYGGNLKGIFHLEQYLNYLSKTYMGFEQPMVRAFAKEAIMRVFYSGDPVYWAWDINGLVGDREENSIAFFTDEWIGKDKLLQEYKREFWENNNPYDFGFDERGAY